jgi:hypothetical protein
MNIYAVVQPNQKEFRNLINSLSLLIDIADLFLISSIEFLNDDGRTFRCVNDPLLDYESLTKNLNLHELASKVKE